MFWFDRQWQDAIPLVDGQWKLKRISVALINDVVIPPRSACCVPTKCMCPTMITDADADGNENIQIKKRINLPNITDRMKDNTIHIVIINWSNKPEKLFAKSIMGTVEKLYDNTDVAVIVDNSSTDGNENAPVGTEGGTV